MKIIALLGMFAVVIYLAYVSASIENEYIESDACKYMRNYKSGQKDCRESAPVSEWTLISENSARCIKTDQGCALRDR